MVRLSEKQLIAAWRSGERFLERGYPRGPRREERQGEALEFCVFGLLGLPPTLVADAEDDHPDLEDIAARAGLKLATVEQLRSLLLAVRGRTGFSVARGWQRLVALTGGDLRLTTIAVAAGLRRDDLDAWAAHGADVEELTVRAARHGYRVPDVEPRPLRRLRRWRRTRVGLLPVRYRPGRSSGRDRT